MIPSGDPLFAGAPPICPIRPSPLITTGIAHLHRAGPRSPHARKLLVRIIRWGIARRSSSRSTSGSSASASGPRRVRVDQDQMGAVRADRVTLCGQAGSRAACPRRRARYSIGSRPTLRKPRPEHGIGGVERRRGSPSKRARRSRRAGARGRPRRRTVACSGARRGRRSRRRRGEPHHPPPGRRPALGSRPILARARRIISSEMSIPRTRVCGNSRAISRRRPRAPYRPPVHAPARGARERGRGQRREVSGGSGGRCLRPAARSAVEERPRRASQERPAGGYPGDQPAHGSPDQTLAGHGADHRTRRQ